MAVDTSPADLESLQTVLPPAAPDTFTPVARPKPRPASPIPQAPAPLKEAVRREEAFTRFCFQEFGQKADPSLSGGVVFIVRVSSDGVSDVDVGDASWTSRAGGAVNSCIVEKAKSAWKLAPGLVKPGRYQIQLNFRGS